MSAPAEYKIKFSRFHEKRGLPCYFVMKLAERTPEDVIEEFWRAVSEHFREQEAQDTMAKLKAGEA